MIEPVAGWTSKVYQGLTEPPLMLGVPMMFCLLNVLTALGMALVWLPWLLVAVGLHGLARMGTAYDMQWSEVLVQHLAYKHFYEG